MRVKLKTSGVNPSDVKSREGRTRKIAFPRVIPHSDGAGDIDTVGDGVPASRDGRAGLDLERAMEARRSAPAPNTSCCRRDLAVKLPAHIGYEAGACLGIPAMTAWHAVEVAGAAKGSTVLVTGGAGGVGHYAIQFAKARGATVLTTISSDAKAELARKAGADHMHRLQARERRRAGHGAHRQGRRRCGDRDGLFAANAKLAPGDPASAQQVRGLRHRQRRRRRSRRSSC